jgi:hypothetical protein
MDAQDIRNLQEAYMEVCDEAYKKFPYKKVEDKIHKKEANNPTGRGTPQSVKMDKVFRHFKGEVRRTERREYSPKISKAKEAENRERGTQKEQVDLYDIILSHLLDEGYAETPEAAEVIMVNMSEDWRESIVEEVLDEELTGARYKRAMEKAGGREALGKIPMTLAARVAVGREGQPLEVARKDPRNSVRTTTKGPTKRGGSGFKRRTKSDFQGVDDTVGSGNKAARRAGKKVKDTSDDL